PRLKQRGPRQLPTQFPGVAAPLLRAAFAASVGGNAVTVLPNPRRDRYHPCYQIEMALDHVTGRNGFGGAHLAPIERPVNHDERVYFTIRAAAAGPPAALRSSRATRAPARSPRGDARLAATPRVRRDGTVEAAGARRPDGATLWRSQAASGSSLLSVCRPPASCRSARYQSPAPWC